MFCLMRHSAVFVLFSMAIAACTSQTTWYGEGTEGQACFPDGTCDPGLECRAGVCTRPITTVNDGGPRADLPRRDRPSVAEDWGLPPPPPDMQPCPNPPSAPVLEPLASSTFHPTVVIRGSASGAQEVRITGGADPQSVHPQDDRFCAEVTLTPNATSQLSSVAVNAEGCVSPPVEVKVSQMQVVSRNLLSGLVPEVSVYPDLGKPPELVDGKTNKSVNFSFFDMTAACDNYFYLWFDLKQLFVVESFTVKYPSRTNFTAYLQCWQLLGCTEQYPFSPEPWHPQWFSMAEDSSTTESVELNIPLGGMVTQHLALLAFENAAKGYNEAFEFTEIEAYGHEVLPPPETCP